MEQVNKNGVEYLREEIEKFKSGGKIKEMKKVDQVFILNLRIKENLQSLIKLQVKEYKSMQKAY